MYEYTCENEVCSQLIISTGRLGRFDRFCSRCEDTISGDLMRDG